MTSSDSEEPPREFDEYRILRLLGEGAMGRVYLAEDTLLEREVAIKIIHQANETRRERFVIEARATARVSHPNIVSIHRIGKIGNQPYIVEEYVRGQILALLPKPMQWQRALELGVGLARGLAAAHRCGVLHRDIKPENVILSDAGAPKLADFGLAKLMDEAEPPAPPPMRTLRETPRLRTNDLADPRVTLRNQSLTEDGAILGTPYYMAPEVWCGEAATMRSDVYSFGVLLYELCAGRVPHYDAPPRDLKSAVVTQDAPPLATRGTDVDPRFAAIVDRCLAREPEERFSNGDALLDALAELDSMTRSTPVPAGSPYRGLAAFEAEHRAVFFGRDVAIREVVERLRTQSIVLIAGESGVGKSSLARAGVLSSITESGLGDGRTWKVCTLVPGAFPLASLAGELARVMNSEETELARELESDCVAVCQRLRRQQGSSAGIVLFVDQLEELVTLAEPREARLASEALACLAQRAPGVKLLCTARGDKLTELAALPGLGALMEPGLYILRPLLPEDIREAIVGPARVKGVRFESEATITALIEAELEAKGGLPLLQFALAQLWEVRDRKRGVIPDRALDELGGVAGALSRHADQVLQALYPETRAAARKILPQFVTSRGTRARRTEDELVGSNESRRAVLRALIDGRLVVVRETDGKAAYEIAHEALIEGWGTLRQWLDEEGSARVLKERLAAAAQDWAKLDRSRDALWGGRRLREAAELDTTDLSTIEADFVKASLREESRGRRFRRMLIAGAFAVLFMVLLIVLQLNREANRAREEAHSLAAESQRHADQAQQNLYDLYREQGRIALLGNDPMRAFTFLLEGVVHAEPEGSDTRFMLARARRLLAGQIMALRAHDDAVVWTEFSPDGSRIATASLDKTVKLWDARTGQLLHAFPGYDNGVWMLAFSPDGAHLATASLDGAVKVWTVDTGQLLWSQRHGALVRWIGYTRDGSKVATTSGDKAARIWDAKTGALLVEMIGHAGEVTTAGFSPDGKYLVTGSADKTARLWDVVTGKQVTAITGYDQTVRLIAISPDGTQVVAGAGRIARIFPLAGKPSLVLAGHDQDLMRFGFSPDGTQLVTASEDRSALVWNTALGKVLLELEGHTGGVMFAAYAPDGRSILTTSRDGTARVWQAASGVLRWTYFGNQSAIWMASFNATGDRFVTAGLDGVVRVWNAHQARYSLALAGISTEVTAAMFSPDGTRIATIERGGAVQVWSREGAQLLSFQAGQQQTQIAWSPDSAQLLVSAGSIMSITSSSEVSGWDARSGQQLFTIAGHQGRVYSAAYDPQGARIVTASADKTAKVWDARTRELLLTLQGHENDVLFAVFDPSGARIITASADRTARLWDARSGALLRTFAGHTLDVVSVRFSPEGARVITASQDNTAKIWTTGGKLIATLDGHVDQVTDAAFSRDGRLVATASQDGTAKMWNATSGIQLWSTELDVIAAPSQSRTWPSAGVIDFSPDGQYLLTTSGHTAAIWDVGYDDSSVEELTAFAECRVSYTFEESRLVARKIDYDACRRRQPR